MISRVSHPPWCFSVFQPHLCWFPSVPLLVFCLLHSINPPWVFRSPALHWQVDSLCLLQAAEPSFHLGLDQSALPPSLGTTLDVVLEAPPGSLQLCLGQSSLFLCHGLLGLRLHLVPPPLQLHRAPPSLLLRYGRQSKPLCLSPPGPPGPWLHQGSVSNHQAPLLVVEFLTPPWLLPPSVPLWAFIL